MLQIIKVQLPISTNDPNAQALMYNKDRSWEGLYPIDQTVLDMMHGEFKRFFYADITDEGHTVSIFSNAPWQEW